jgi:hypothetical protein
MRQTADGSFGAGRSPDLLDNSARVPSSGDLTRIRIPPPPGVLKLRSPEEVFEAQSESIAVPIPAAVVGQEIVPLHKPKMLHDEEDAGKRFIAGVAEQEEFLEKIRKYKWYFALCVWCFVMIIWFIIAFVYWHAVRSDHVYYLDEVPAICEDMYTMISAAGSCSVQVYIRDCYKPEGKPEKADCSRMNEAIIAYEQRSNAACDWYTDLFGRYKCWYQKDDDKNIRPDTIRRTQSPRMFSTTVAGGVVFTTFLLCMCCCSAFYARMALREWREFACQPWNHWEE